MNFSLVLPFHNFDAAVLFSTLNKITNECAEQGIVEVILAHNGAPLDCPLPAIATAGLIKFLHTDTKGLGAGYKIGILNATADYVILSSVDLPFGWSDLQAFKQTSNCDFAIGSKGHPESQLQRVTIKRRIVSRLFYGLRRLLLGKNTPYDSQGSLIIKIELARQLVKQCECDDYLISLELACLQLRSNGKVTELPIKVGNVSSATSISIIRDGVRMMKGVWRIRQRLIVGNRR